MDESKKTPNKLVEQFMNQLKKTKESKPDPNKNQPDMYQQMGLPTDWIQPNTVFVRTFRWTLNVPNHPKVNMWIQKINVNYKDKMVEIEAFEDAHGCVYEWLVDIISDSASRNFTINHYDGCGKIIFTNNYLGIEIKDHKVAYDYLNSDVLTHKLKLSYRNLKRSNNLTVN